MKTLGNGERKLTLGGGVYHSGIVQKGQGTAIGRPASCYGESVVPQPNPAPPNALTASWRLEMGLPQGPARAVTEPQDDIDG